jgi:hypothetical protein
VYSASSMNGLLSALLGTVLLAALNTFGDFIWARFIPSHRMAFGVVHGAVLCLAIGLYLGVQHGRALLGALGGAVVGVLAAGCFYALAGLLRYAAMFPAWMALWIGFALLDARVLRGQAGNREALVRGALAAVFSGLAFYAISGIWTRPQPGGPDYAYHFVCWAIAFLPGFVALCAPRPGAAKSVPSV